MARIHDVQTDHTADTDKKVKAEDCISRQAAIDLFPNDALEWDTKGGYIAPHLARRMIEELPSAQPDHIAESGKKVEQTGETAQNVQNEDLISRKWLVECIEEGWVKFDTAKDCNRMMHLVRDIAPSVQPEQNAQDEDLISRKAAIDALARMMPRSYTPDGSHPADEEIFRAQEVFADCIEALEILPSAQPEILACGEGELNVPDTNVGDMISRQAAIDALDVLCQEHRYKIPGKRETYSQYNEAWQDALDRAEGAIFNLPTVQPDHTADVSKKAEGDCISRQAAIDAICKACSMVEDYHKCDYYPETSILCDELVALRALPSVQPDHTADIGKKVSIPNGSDDTISRQAAIRWVKTECNPYGKPTLDFESGKKVIEHLEQMPPARPGTCEGCKHLGKWENEVEYGYPSPCTRCRRRAEDHYER